MAAIGIALWKYVMRYSPENPNFFNRDRFILSNGELYRLPTMFRFQEIDIESHLFRPLLFVAVHLHAPCRLQEHDA